MKLMETLLHHATLDDAAELADMNRMLIEDEGSDNPMAREALEARMRGWLTSGVYQAVLLRRQGEVVGYVLYRQETNEYNVAQQIVYVRQFFVKRTYRRRGIGRAAFEQVVAQLFPPDAVIILEVLATNLQGRAFWERLGFEPYFTTYRRLAGRAPTKQNAP
jgi:ribosomal protein S18 acetylase RimI-like enzyme